MSVAYHLFAFYPAVLKNFSPGMSEITPSEVTDSLELKLLRVE